MGHCRSLISRVSMIHGFMWLRGGEPSNVGPSFIARNISIRYMHDSLALGEEYEWHRFPAVRWNGVRAIGASVWL